MTGPGDPTHVAPGEHVDVDAVEWSRAALTGNGHAAVLDLGRVRSWDRAALPAMAALLDGAPGSLQVVRPPVTSFLPVLGAMDVRGIWPVFDDVRRLRRAAARLGPSRPAPRPSPSGPGAPPREGLRGRPRGAAHGPRGARARADSLSPAGGPPPDAPPPGTG